MRGKTIPELTLWTVLAIRRLRFVSGERKAARGRSKNRQAHQSLAGNRRQARRRGTQGTIVLAVAINKNGGVDKVKVVRRLDADLDRNAVDAVKQWRFAPAEKNGEAVPLQTLVEVSFSLH
jgi:TonB family protein